MAIHKHQGYYTLAGIYLIGMMMSCSALAATQWQSRESIQAAAEAFVQEKTAGIAGEVSISSTPPDARVKVGKCDSLETSLPSGNRLWGRASVKVSCSSPVKWALYVPVLVKVTGKALVSTRAIGGGQVIEPQDVEVQVIDLTPYPVGVFTQPEQVIGKTTAASIPAGSPVRPEVLRAALVIRQGQQVIVIARGENFKVSSEGRAMGNATAGQIVAVKTKSGQIVKGVAKDDGTVEVAF
jgi:flagella basal body P-ring formation protein FlgA